jgi:light-regulated signal transduction histidine kinase (bacteriophytochrome)
MRSNKELEQFAFLAAHDLQEPLSITALYAQMLERKYKGRLDDQAESMISSIIDNTERMQKLVQSLLSFARAGKGNIQFKELDSNMSLRQAIENLKVKIDESLIQIRCGHCPVISGDEMQLTQLFQNLIHNAIKFRKKNADTVPFIHISAQEKNAEWIFSIHDNGIGMEAQHTPLIFELFTRLNARGEYPGSGIGLSLCKRIVEFHGGKIWAESLSGEGTTVFFTIPKY